MQRQIVDGLVDHLYPYVKPIVSYEPTKVALQAGGAALVFSLMSKYMFPTIKNKLKIPVFQTESENFKIDSRSFDLFGRLHVHKKYAPELFDRILEATDHLLSIRRKIQDHITPPYLGDRPMASRFCIYIHGMLIEFESLITFESDKALVTDIVEHFEVFLLDNYNALVKLTANPQQFRATPKLPPTSASAPVPAPAPAKSQATATDSSLSAAPTSPGPVAAPLVVSTTTVQPSVARATPTPMSPFPSAIAPSAPSSSALSHAVSPSAVSTVSPRASDVLTATPTRTLTSLPRTVVSPTPSK
jgi:hypothetical protein